MEEPGPGSPASGGALDSDREVVLPRRELLAMWKAIEKLVVSADRIGGAHEYAQEGESGETIVDEEMRAAHDRALAEYLEELGAELIEARNALLEHLDLTSEEAEHLTRNVIQYWSASRPSFDYDGDELEEPDISLV
jgi:hypothetical protein